MKLEYRYTGTDNFGRPKIDYLSKLEKMNEKDLFKETEMQIWLSAYAANNPISDYHWKCDACYDVCASRNRVDIYQKAWEMASGA